MTKEIAIFCHKVTTRAGKTFDAFHCFDKLNRKVQVKFTTACEELCGKASPGVLIAESENLNLDERGRYTTLWVRAYTEIKPFEPNTKRIDETF